MPNRVTVTLLLIVACSSIPVLAKQPAPTMAQRQVEINFMRGMIDHHYQAVQSAQLCLEKAVHNNLRELCQNIVASQQSEIGMMQGWLSQWYDVSYSPELDRGARTDLQMLSSKAAGDFESSFMQMMTQHHWQAIIRASAMLQEASHRELEKEGENIIKGQTVEIITMQKWLCDWYGNCDWTAHGDPERNNCIRPIIPREPIQLP